MAGRGWPVVSHLHFIELYLDRASDVWRALQVQAAAAPGELVVTEAVTPGPGALPRLLDSGYRGADYDFMSALTEQGKSGEARIVYTLDTKRARSEVRAQATQSRLLRQLLAGTTHRPVWRHAAVGRTLFKLLMPIEMEPFLGGTTEMQIEVDGGTAGIPWEMLENETTGGSDPRPWAIRTKLLRKLRTVDFRGQVVDASADASVLVIGEPACDPDYPRLPGARDEALAVEQCLSARAGRRSSHGAHQPGRRRAGRCRRTNDHRRAARVATGASSTSPGMARRRRRSARRRKRRATLRSRTATRAASCFPTAHSSVRAKSAACAGYPSWSSSIAATSPRATKRSC